MIPEDTRSRVQEPILALTVIDLESAIRMPIDARLGQDKLGEMLATIGVRESIVVTSEETHEIELTTVVGGVKTRSVHDATHAATIVQEESTLTIHDETRETATIGEELAMLRNRDESHLATTIARSTLHSRNQTTYRCRLVGSVVSTSSNCQLWWIQRRD